jgi:hypothetical protein
MDGYEWLWFVGIAALVLLVAVAIAVAMRKRHRRQLRDQFGPEYDRTVEQADKRRHAESELRDRIDLRSRSNVRQLAPAARDRYSQQWQDVQARFVDEPVIAVAQADSLVTTVMRERGYPIDDWEQQASMVSVDHPQMAEDYRYAHEIAERGRSGQTSTDEHREAFLRYRSLFDALLDTRDEDSGTPSDEWRRPVA